VKVIIDIRSEHIAALIDHTRNKLSWLRSIENVSWIKDSIPNVHQQIVQAEQDLEYFKQFKLQPASGAQG